MTLALLLAAALLQTPAMPAKAPVVAFDLPATQAAGEPLGVSSGSFGPGGFIPQENSGYGKNLSPSLTWTAGPPKTRSYVVLVEDPDGEGPQPILHWLAYDLAPSQTNLESKTRNAVRVKEPEPGFSQGQNDHGGLGWTGPHPPVGSAPHHYHFQVFALDRMSGTRPGSDRATLLNAMRGHVLAKGQVIGLYAQAPERVRRDKSKPAQAVPAAPAASTPAS